MNTLDCINSQCGASAGDCGCAARVREAAAFLDVLAHHITRWPAIGRHLKEQQQATADCRAMAKKLKG